MTNTTTIQNIRLFLISPSPMNPRKTFDDEALKELAANIEKQGLLQPITVRPSEWDDRVEDGEVISTPSMYEIVCGERRYRACSLLKMETIPCIVREMTDEEALDAMITENLQRRDVDPIEEAEAFRLLNERGQKVEDLALRFGKSEKYVRDRMRLTSLTAPLQKALSTGRIPLGGAYLLAWLTEDQQKDFQEFLKDEYTDDAQLRTDEVTEWLDDYFMVIRNSPFQDGHTLDETWNPKGKLIRRCDKCECNTARQTCLFADMASDDAQCTNRKCFERKTDIYYDWFINQYASRIVREGQSVTSTDVALVEGWTIYNKDDKKRLEDLKEKLAIRGYRIFTEKQLGSRYWGSGDKLKEDLKAGKIVEAIDICDMASQQNVKTEYHWLNGKVASSSPAEPSNMVARLCERSANIENNAQRKITSLAKAAFDKDAYIACTSRLDDWEYTVMAAIVFDMTPWIEQDELIAGARNTNLTYQQIHKFFNSDGHNMNYSWMRRAIASYIFKEHKQTFLAEAVQQLSPKAYVDITSVRADARKRIEAINDELREMGYDENGNKL